ncbi:hypothetical protein BGZ50_002888 [Haplosporangium sp. Z 11]|nr:hypothetical protein BGZ50_002888 [Haplosporangium sp. Z 11]
MFAITLGIVAICAADAAPTASAAADTASPAFATKSTDTIACLCFVPEGASPSTSRSPGSRFVTENESASLSQAHTHQHPHQPEQELRNEHNREHPQDLHYGSELQREFFRRLPSTVAQPAPTIGQCPVRTHVEEYLGTIDNFVSYEYNYHRQLEEHGGESAHTHNRTTDTATPIPMLVANPYKNSVNNVNGIENTKRNNNINGDNTSHHNNNPVNEIMFLNGAAFEILGDSKRTSVCSNTSATIATATATTIFLARPIAISTPNRTQHPSRLEAHIQDQSTHSLDTHSSYAHTMGAVTASTSSTACAYGSDLDTLCRGTVGKDGQDSLKRMSIEEEKEQPMNALNTTETTSLVVAETTDVGADTDARLVDATAATTTITTTTTTMTAVAATAAATDATGFTRATDATRATETKSHLQQPSSVASDIVILYDIACKYTESFDSAAGIVNLRTQNTIDEGMEPQGGDIGTSHGSYADVDYVSSSSTSPSLAVQATFTHGGEDDNESKENDEESNTDMNVDKDEVATHGKGKEKAKDDNEDEVMVLIPLSNKITNKNTSSLSSTSFTSSEKAKGILVVTHWRKPPELQERLQGIITLQELMDYALCTDTAAGMTLVPTPVLAPAPVHEATSQSTAALTGNGSNGIEETFSGVKTGPTDAVKPVNTANVGLTHSESLHEP